MRVLCMHPAFPGPLRYLAAGLGALKDSTVLFLSERRRRDAPRLPGVRSMILPGTPTTVADGDEAEREFQTALRRASRTANTLLHLRRDGFIPDLIVGTTSMAGTLYLKDIFPDAFYIAHADWFHTKGENYTFFTRGKQRAAVEFAPARMRNLFQLNALSECDLVMTSTEWQRSQYPAPLAEQMHVMRHLVDTDFFSPDSHSPFIAEHCDLSGVTELVTFSGRSAEPTRGFHQFYRSLPRLFAARPTCHALIMIGDTPRRTAASPVESSRPIHSALASLMQDVPLDPARVHILGFRPYDEYRLLLRNSSVHIYLSAPFALSTGLFEAMSCGCMVIGSDTPPVREVIRHGENGFLCDFWDTDQLADMTATLLDRKDKMAPLRAAARASIVEQYDMRRVGPGQLQHLLHAYQTWKTAQDRSRT